MRIQNQQSIFPQPDLTTQIRQKIPDKITVKQTINKGTIEYWVLVAIVETFETFENSEITVQGWGRISAYHTKLRASWSQRFQELASTGIIDYEIKDRKNSVYLIKNLGSIIKTVCAFGEIENKRFGHLKQKYNPQD